MALNFLNNGIFTGAVTAPSFTGDLTATSILINGVTAFTQLTTDNSTKVATTAFVKSYSPSGSGVTSITKGAGLIVSGSPITTTGSVAVEYAANVQNIITGGSNFIGQTVVSTDQILITDPGVTSTNRRVGRVTVGDLLAAGGSGTVTGITEGPGITVTASATSPTVAVDYIGTDSLVMEAADAVPDQDDYIIFGADSSGSGDTNKIQFTDVNLSLFNNDSGFISSITGGAGITASGSNVAVDYVGTDSVIKAAPTLSVAVALTDFLLVAGSNGNVYETTFSNLPFNAGTVTGTGTAGTVTKWSTGGTGIEDGPITFSGNNSTFTGTVTVGADTDGHDVKFFGNATGEYMLWDESDSKLRIYHTASNPAVDVFTVSAAPPTYPQMRVGRNAAEFWGVYTDDRNAHLVHRQDETTGTMTTRFDQWDSNTSDALGHWAWRSGNGSGGAMSTAFLLTQAGDATFAGDLTISGGDITSNGIQIISNSTTASTLLIGDVTLGDTIQEMRLQVYGADLINLQDDEISLKSSTVKITGSLSTTAPATYLGLLSSTGILTKRTPAQVLADIGGAPATGGSYLPLSAGTSYPLTDNLFTRGDDKGLVVQNAASTTNVTVGAVSSSAVSTGLITLRHLGVTKIVLNANDNSYFTGNVGIGTTSPASSNKLQVDGQVRVVGSMMIGDSNTSNTTAGGQLHIKNTGEAAIRLEDSDASNLAFDIKVNEGEGFVITESIGGQAGGDNDRLVIQETTGYVGIGTATPGTKLDIQDVPANIDGLRVSGNATTSQSYGVRINAGTNSSDYALAVANQANSALFRVRGDGNVGIGTTSPGAKLEVAGNVIIETTGVTDNLLLTSTDTSASSAPDIVMYRNAAVADSDTLGVVEYKGKNGMVPSSTTPLLYNAIYSRIADASNNQSILTLSANKGNGAGAFTHAVNISAIGTNNSATGALLINPASDFQLPQYNLDVDGTAYVSGTMLIGGTTTLSTIVNATIDTDKFLVSDSGVVKYRTGAQVLSDIGGAPATGGSYLPLAGGTMTAGGTTFFPDNTYLNVGTSGDAVFYHDGTNTVLRNYTGDFYIDNNSDDKSIIFRNDDGAGGVETYFQLEGASGGASPFTVFPDSSTLAFGTGHDFRLYNNGSNSYQENYTGNIYISNYANDKNIQFSTDNGSGGTAAYILLNGANGSVVLNHYGSTKLATTSTGVTVTGAATATTFLGDLNGTINTATTGVTQVNAIDNTTIATTAYVNNKIALIPAGLVFQGTWNASTNTPTLTSGSGTTGNFYIVSVAGSTNLDGITDWKVGDWAVFIEQGASDQWEKIDNSSVLDGLGTGQSVTKWDGSGTSNTLTDGPITFSGGTSTFNIDADSVFVIGDGGTNAVNITAVAGDELYIGANNAYQIRLKTNGDTVWDNGGNVGIGATDPVKKLDVRGQLAISNSTTSYWYLDRNDSTGTLDINTDDDVTRLKIDSDSNITIGTSGGGINEGAILLQNDHYVNKRFSFDPLVSNSTIAYMILCKYAAYSDVNGIITMDRTSGLRHACSIQVLVSSGSGTAPVGGLKSIGVAGSGTPSYQLVTCDYDDGSGSSSHIAVKMSNPDAYYETSGAYFTGRIVNSNDGVIVPVLPAAVSNVVVFEVNCLHNFQGDVVMGNGTLATQSDALLTLNAPDAFAGLDINSQRTSGNIGGLRFRNSSNTEVATYFVTTDGVHNWYAGQSSTINMTLDASGDVGIGTTLPSEKLEVVGNIMLDVNNWLKGHTTTGSGTQNLIRSRAMGYPGYYGLQVGVETNHIALFIDPNSIAGGAFSGNVNELMLPNKVIFQQANSAGTDWLNGQSITLDNGNVGIGVTNYQPLGKLHVTLPAYTNEDTNSQQAIFGVASGYGVRIGYNETDNKGYINVLKPGVAWGSLILQEDVGKVGIGTTTPETKLHIYKGESSGAAANTDSGLTIENSTSTYLQFLTPATSESGILFGDTDNDRGALVYNHSTDAMNFRIAATTKMTITSAGNVGINSTAPPSLLDIQPTASNRKVTKIANDVMSTYFYNTQADAILAWTCGSYYQAEVVITANQTNGGTTANLYIRGIWSNNHTSHHWDELEHIGSLPGSTITMSVGQDGATTASGRLELDFDYISGSFAQLNVRVTDFYGSHSYTIT